MSYAEQAFLAEEIGREVARNIKIPSQPDVILRTEETRPTKASIINHNLHEANKWYEIKLPKDAITWAITTRGHHEIQYSYSPTHQTYRTLRAGESLEADTAPNAEINAVYVMSEEGNVVAELEVWRR